MSLYYASLNKIWQNDLTSTVRLGRSGTGLACYLNSEEFLAIQKNYLASILAPMLRGLQPDQIFLEKTPSHAQFIPEIITLLPSARIIHLVRDPRDVTASLLAASQSWGQNWAAHRVKDAVKCWYEHVRAARKAGALVPAGQFIEIQYEDLFADPVRHLGELAGFLHLAWPEAEIRLAVEANRASELKQGKGTPIPIRGELGKSPDTVVQEPKDFIRKAKPGSWKEDLTLLQRWQFRRAMRKISRTWVDP